ncbi:MAG: nitric oxide dioxygenase [Asticcacaulis sp. 32-58-5]|nr:MAG: nitric oxide dioxygenase [Asticcacaulis sp. 32-58-5]
MSTAPLSPETIAIVKATASVLNEHGETLTRHFYQRMFRENPEVLPLFNPSNQHSGGQQKALAGAICAYAANIDNLEVLGGAVELIAQKHASLLIAPEHYPIVGANLLAAIREVLGEAATDAVIGAWAEAYGFLAEILMGRERQIYEAQAAQANGWHGFKVFTVVRKVEESDTVTSFYLAPADGSAVPDFKAGQYITIRAPYQDSTTMRNYSLSDKPGRAHFRISVKREVGLNALMPGGLVSNWLHDAVEVGQVVEIAPPCGEFYLEPASHPERPLVLLAAGIGITPILSMLEQAIEVTPDREIIFIHANLNRDTHAFRARLETLMTGNPKLKVHFRYDDAGDASDAHISTGLINAELIESFVPNRDADYYFCGPHGFMTAIYRDLLKWGIPSAQVHFEFFGPKQGLDAAA